MSNQFEILSSPFLFLCWWMWKWVLSCNHSLSGMGHPKDQLRVY